jgi:hypothetical protein
MKLTGVLSALVLVASATAVALPNAEAITAAGRVKRAAEAFAEALAEPAAEPQDDSLLARHARRLTRDLASIVAETQDDPEAYYNSLGLSEDNKDTYISERSAICGFRGQPCGKAKREAGPEPEPVCGFRGQPCGKTKRGAGPEPEPICGFRGQPCGKLRRAAEAVAEAVAIAEPEPVCGFRGQPCGKAKRDAHALAHAADIALDQL